MLGIVAHLLYEQSKRTVAEDVVQLAEYLYSMLQVCVPWDQSPA